MESYICKTNKNRSFYYYIKIFLIVLTSLFLHISCSSNIQKNNENRHTKEIPSSSETPKAEEGITKNKDQYLDKIISITEFDNTTKSSEFSWLEVGISDMISTDFVSLKKCKIVKRSDLKKILDEQTLQVSGLVKEEKDNKIGKLVGADLIITGNFIIINQEDIVLNANVINVETGISLGATSVNGKISDLFSLEKIIVENLFEELNFELSSQEKYKFMQFKTSSIEAAKNNYKGLIAFEGNHKKEAKLFFEEALKFDSNYGDAKENLNTLEINGESVVEIAHNQILSKDEQISLVNKIYSSISKNIYKINFDDYKIFTNNSCLRLNIPFKVSYSYECINEIIGTFSKFKEGNIPFTFYYTNKNNSKCSIRGTLYDDAIKTVSSYNVDIYKYEFLNKGKYSIYLGDETIIFYFPQRIIIGLFDNKDLEIKRTELFLATAKFTDKSMLDVFCIGNPESIVQFVTSEDYYKSISSSGTIEETSTGIISFENITLEQAKDISKVKVIDVECLQNSLSNTN